MVDNAEYLQPDPPAEVVESKYHPAPPRGKRFAAFLIDSLIAAVPMTVSGVFLLLPVFWMMTMAPLPPLYENEALYFTIAAIFTVSVLWFIFYALCRDGLGGRSFGKRICGLMVITVTESKPCPMGKSMLRNLLMVLVGLFNWFIPLIGVFAFLVEPIAILTSPQGLRIGDRWAETQVVETKLVRP